MPQANISNCKSFSMLVHNSVAVALMFRILHMEKFMIDGSMDNENSFNVYIFLKRFFYFEYSLYFKSYISSNYWNFK